jgi:hypothetical protein
MSTECLANARHVVVLSNDVSLAMQLAGSNATLLTADNFCEQGLADMLYYMTSEAKFRVQCVTYLFDNVFPTRASTWELMAGCRQVRTFFSCTNIEQIQRRFRVDYFVVTADVWGEGAWNQLRDILTSAEITDIAHGTPTLLPTECAAINNLTTKWRFRKLAIRQD